MSITTLQQSTVSSPHLHSTHPFLDDKHAGIVIEDAKAPVAGCYTSTHVLSQGPIKRLKVLRHRIKRGSGTTCVDQHKHNRGSFRRREEAPKPCHDSGNHRRTHLHDSPGREQRQRSPSHM